MKKIKAATKTWAKTILQNEAKAPVPQTKYTKSQDDHYKFTLNHGYSFFYMDILINFHSKFSLNE